MAAIMSRFASSGAECALSMKAVRKTFSRGLARAIRRTAALVDVDLEIEAGEVVAISGAESAGKTTLLQCAAGLLRPDAGEVRWFGELFPGGGVVPGVAYVPAIPVFYPFLTVRDVVAYRAARDLAPREKPDLAVMHALDALDFAGRASERVALLTRAESKRLAVAEALASRPGALLIDTCTSDLSPPISEITCRAVAAFAGSGGSVLIGILDASHVAGVATRRHSQCRRDSSRKRSTRKTTNHR
jgi:ABC-type multidrug transport system ATPase subunit